MNSLDFTYWLKGFLDGKKQLSTQELNQIKQKIGSILTKVTPASKDSAEDDNNDIIKDFCKKVRIKGTRGTTYC